VALAMHLSTHRALEAEVLVSASETLGLAAFGAGCRDGDIAIGANPARWYDTPSRRGCHHDVGGVGGRVVGGVGGRVPGGEVGGVRRGELGGVRRGVCRGRGGGARSRVCRGCRGLLTLVLQLAVMRDVLRECGIAGGALTSVLLAVGGDSPFGVSPDATSGICLIYGLG
jgi:hypothetical protein